MVGWFCKDCKKNLVEMDLTDVGGDDKIVSTESSLPSSSETSSFSNTDTRSSNKYSPSSGNFQPYITHELESMIKTLKIDSAIHRISNDYRDSTLVAVIDCLVYHHYNSVDIELLKNFFFEFNQKLENPLEIEELEYLWHQETAFIEVSNDDDEQNCSSIKPQNIWQEKSDLNLLQLELAEEISKRRSID